VVEVPEEPLPSYIVGGDTFGPSTGFFSGERLSGSGTRGFAEGKMDAESIGGRRKLGGRQKKKHTSTIATVTKKRQKEKPVGGERNRLGSNQDGKGGGE